MTDEEILKLKKQKALWSAAALAYKLCNMGSKAEISTELLNLMLDDAERVYQLAVKEEEESVSAAN